MKNQPGNMKNQPGTMKNHENRPGTMNNQPGTMNTHENRPGTINKQKRYKQTDTQNLPIIYRLSLESGLANKTFGHCNGAIIGSFLQKILRQAPYQSFCIEFLNRIVA